jgi:hypothetical protein
MKPLGKMIGLLLLLAMAAPIVLAYGPAQITRQKPAGCHEQGQKSSVPEPVTYQCCRAGHQFAAVREVVEVRSPLVQWFYGVELGVAPLLVLVGQSQPNLSGSGSPGITCLRI